MAAKKRNKVSPKKVLKKSTTRPIKKGSLVKTSSRNKMTIKKPKAAQSPKMLKTAPVNTVHKAYTKSQILIALSGSTGIPRKEVALLFEHLNLLLAAHLKKQGPGHFTLPGLVKITIKHKPATKARRGINPFTKTEMMFKAKPARNIVKIRPLQKLKQMA